MKFGLIQVATALLVGLTPFVVFAAPSPGGKPEPPSVLVPEGEPYEKIRPLLDQVRPPASVQSVAFSPDGRLLASGSYDNTVRLWDVGSGRESMRLQGHGEMVASVAFSPDGKTLASGSDDKTVRLWDLTNGQVVALLEGHGSAIRSVAFSPDGRAVASGSVDNTVRVWDAASGRELYRFEGHEAPVLSVAFAPDGRTLASGSGDSLVRLWDLDTRRLRTRFKGHDAAVFSVAFSPDGKTLASSSGDKTALLWDVANGRARGRLFGHDASIQSVAFSPDGRTLVGGSDDRTVRLWDVSSGREIVRLEGHLWQVKSVAFSPDGRTLASGSFDGTMRLWDALSGRERARLVDNESQVESVAFSTDGRTVASGSSDKLVRLWDVASGNEIAQLEGHDGSVRSVAFSPDGRLLASGSTDRTVRLWDVASGMELRRLDGHAGSISAVAFSPDAQTLASGSIDKTVRLWEVSNGLEIDRLEDQNSEVLAIAYSPDGRTLASSSLDGTVRLWSVSSGHKISQLGIGAIAQSIAFSPDGELLASGSSDGTVRLWDLVSGREKKRLEGHRFWFGSVAFSPDGAILAIGYEDGTVRLWDVESGRDRAILKGHRKRIKSIAFSPDGFTLASGGSDSTLRLWTVPKGSDGVHVQDKTTGPGSMLPVEKGIIGLGPRGNWAACMSSQSKCFRRDDGTLLTLVDPSGQVTPILPAGQAQPLRVALMQPAVAVPLPTSAIVVDPASVLTLKVQVWNQGQGRAFWVRMVPLTGQTSADWALEPAEALLRLEGDGQPVTLNARIHFLDECTNPTGCDRTIHLAVAQAFGESTPLKPIAVKIVPQLLQVHEAAVVVGDGGQRLLSVTPNYSGPAFEILTYRVIIPAFEGHPRRVQEAGFGPASAMSSHSFSFGLDADLPSGIEANIFAVARSVGLGMPELDWELDNIPIRASPARPLLPIAGLLALVVLSVVVGVRYQMTYRHPAVVRLTSSPAALHEVELGDVGAARRALRRASRLEAVLRAAKVDPSWLDAATGLEGEPEGEARLAILAKRLGFPIAPTPAGGLPSLTLPQDFPLNLPRLRLRALADSEAPRDVVNELSRAGEVTLALGATAAQRRDLSAMARKQPGMLVAPDGSELTRLMFAEDPADELVRLIARYVLTTQISPYQTGAGVHRQVLFFGRAGILAQVMGRDPANYLIVGGRQVGKSSVLKEVQRRYKDHPQTDCRYLVLTGANGIAPIAGALGLPAQVGIGGLLDEFRLRGRRHTLFLLDEADVFIEQERQHGYEILQALRALSEEGHAHFMLAGFWSLYRQAALDYQSPLKNFGSVLTLGALERDACRSLAVEPMERLGVHWESDALVDRLIEQTGQRANLISIACDEALYTLGQSERTISAASLESVLAGNRVRDALLGWADLSANNDESRIDRIVVYATVDRESFTLADLLTTLEEAAYAADPENIKNSLARLELAFVLGRRGNEYAYQVPLQRDLIRADDTRQLLRTEIRAASA